MASNLPKGALGVVDVQIHPRRWPPLWLLLPATSSSNNADDGNYSSLRIARRWGLALEASADGTGAIEVAWSKAPGVRAGDVLLALQGQAVVGWPLAAVEKLLLAALEEEADGDDRRGSSTNRTGLRLTLDVTKGWGVSSSGRQRQRLHQGGWGRFACRWVLDGYDRLLDARCCPQRKLPLHTLALLLLFPVVESAFQSATALSDKHGPLLLLPHAHLLAFERIWSAGFALAALGLGLGCCLLVRRPRLGAALVDASALLLHCLLVALLLIPAVVGLTLVISGFVLLPPAVEAGGSEAGAAAIGEEEAWDLEGELRGLLTHVLCALILPLLAGAYLRRLAAFCDGYAALLGSRKNPRLLGLVMPLSAHFVAAEGEERERFLALRSCGY